MGLRPFLLAPVSGPESIMQLVINGQEKDLKSSRNIAQMLQELDITGSHIAVALNHQVVPRANYDQTSLKDGDKVEIVHAVGGG